MNARLHPTRVAAATALLALAAAPWSAHADAPPPNDGMRFVSAGAQSDTHGNRQLLSTGNLAAQDKVALFLMDYPQRTRLKILGHARVEDARQHPELVQQLAEPEARRIVERLFFIEVVSFDWNCPKYITPRYNSEEVQEVIAPLKQRITDLEAQLKNSK